MKLELKHTEQTKYNIVNECVLEVLVGWFCHLLTGPGKLLSSLLN